MSWLDRILRRKQLRTELREEVEGHIAERIEFLMAQGVTPDEAARQARRAFGNAPLAVERSAETWQFRWLELLGADIRFAFHQLRKSPGYTVTAVLTLAIGIGANAAIFTVIDDAMLRSLPIQQPGELVSLGYRSPSVPNFIHVQFWPMLTHLRSDLHDVSDIAGWSGSMVTIPDDRNTLRSVGADLVTGNALTMLGIRPYLGRLLTPGDDVPGGTAGGWPVVLDYGFWQANFHGNPAVIGQRLRITGQPAIVVGVLPPDFHGLYVGEPQKLFLPLHFMSALAVNSQEDPFLHPENLAVAAVARLQPGAGVAALNAQLAAMSPHLVHAVLPPRLQNNPVFLHAHLAAQSVSRGFSEIAEDYSKPLLLIQGIVLAVLLLCCVNLAGLQTAKLQSRQHEFALRSALGASHGRILQQCLVESLLLAALGAVFAVALAWSSIRTISGFFTPPGSGEPMQLQPDAHILFIAGGLALLTTLLFGLVPAFVAVRSAPQAMLKSKGTNARRDTLRNRVFIPVQFALALALVFTAGLFTHTLLRLRSNHAGFNPSYVIEVTAQFQALKKSSEAIAELYRSMTDALRASPGVTSAAYTWVTPLTGFAPKLSVHSLARPQDERSISYNDVSDGYFATVGTGLLSGREFTEEDRDRSVCIVNQAAAVLLFPGGHALDDSMHVDNPGGREPKFTAVCRVVGIAENARYSSLRDPAPPTVYFPAAVYMTTEDGSPNNLVFFIRSPSAGEAISAYRAALARFAPSTGYMTFLPLSDQVDQSLGSERLIAELSNAFAGIALLLSGVGLFGVLALRVQQRLPEMGVRIAVGASRGNILLLVVRDALSMVAVGAVAGVLLIGATTAFTRRFLYDTSPVQISVAGSALLILVAVALAATLAPARRAAWLDPVQVLRNE